LSIVPAILGIKDDKKEQPFYTSLVYRLTRGFMAQEDLVSLGGNIELVGFSKVESLRQIVLKKIIGNYVRQIQDKRKDYEKLSITLLEQDNDCKVKVELKLGANILVSESVDCNVFMAADSALKKIIAQA